MSDNDELIDDDSSGDFFSEDEYNSEDDEDHDAEVEAEMQKMSLEEPS